MERLRKAAFVAGIAAIALGAGTASASAVASFHVESNGVAGAVAAPGTTFEATSANVKLLDYATGNTAYACTSVTMTGGVGSGSSSIDVGGMAFTCTSPILGPLTITAGGLPWNITASGASSPFGLGFTNWTTLSLGFAAPGCTATYTTGTSPTGFTLVNASGGSKVTAVKAGPLYRSGPCPLVPTLGLSGTLTVTKVAGAPATATNNLWGVG